MSLNGSLPALKKGLRLNLVFLPGLNWDWTFNDLPARYGHRPTYNWRSIRTRAEVERTGGRTDGRPKIEEESLARSSVRVRSSVRHRSPSSSHLLARSLTLPLSPLHSRLQLGLFSVRPLFLPLLPSSCIVFHEPAAGGRAAHTRMDARRPTDRRTDCRAAGNDSEPTR